MQMLSAGHIEETEMLQDSEQQTRAPSTSLQTPERAVTVDAQLSPPIFMGAGAEETPKVINAQ